jgi:hypothetical protein
VKRGIACDRVRTKALAIIDTGADMEHCHRRQRLRFAVTRRHQIRGFSKCVRFVPSAPQIA